MIAKFERLRRELIQNLTKDKKEALTNEEQLKEKPQTSSNQQKSQIPSKILLADKEGSQKYSYLLKQLNNPYLKLLFRASQHSFSAASFHQYCDGISDTVTIFRTEFGRTIAAYTPLKWNSSNGDYVADYSQRSFILQLELREKMTLTVPQLAIGHHSNYGPIFGGGQDFLITDQCNINKQSFSSFPHSYNCNGKYQNNEQSNIAFCGSSEGYFRVADYEVFVVSR